MLVVRKNMINLCLRYTVIVVKVGSFPGSIVLRNNSEENEAKASCLLREDLSEQFASIPMIKVEDEEECDNKSLVSNEISSMNSSS